MSGIDTSDVDANIIEIAERAKKAAWKVEWTPKRDNTPSLRLFVPNGRNYRPVVVNAQRANRLARFDFETFRFLGDYMAINHPGDGYIEALIRPVGAFRYYSIEDVPGAEAVEEIEFDSESTSKDLGERYVQAAETRRTHSDFWKLRVRDERHSWHLEISPITSEFLGLSSVRLIGNIKRYSLKIFGTDAPQHDDAVSKLEGIGGSFLFNLDLRYSVLYELTLQRAFSSSTGYEANPIEQSPSLPQLQYPSQAMSLYTYGRSASGMPLLQFLAYYQVLEYFFPMYSQREVIRKLRQTITSPRFTASNDADLARILQLTSSNGRSGYGSERDQLKATVNGCTNPSGILELFHSNAEFFRALCDKKTIKDVPVIDENNRSIPILDQVAARVYALRNRVVHAKADGGETAVELLLPGSVEAESMAADIALMRFLAQEAIVAGGVQIQ